MKRHGFFILEAVVGMTLLMIIIGVFAVTLNLREQVHRRADSRGRAIDRAEAVLISMQNGRPVELADVMVQPLDTAASPSFRWVRVISAYQGERCELIGLVPVEAHP